MQIFDRLFYLSQTLTSLTLDAFFPITCPTSWVECSRSLKLAALINNRAVSLIRLLDIRAVNLTDLFLLEISTFVLKLVEDQHEYTTSRM